MAKHKAASSFRGQTLLDIPCEVATADGLLFKGTRLIVPKVMRPEMLRQIHKSHLGIAKCRRRAKEVLFWPGMSLDVEQMVTNCSVCVCVCRFC